MSRVMSRLLFVALGAALLFVGPARAGSITYTDLACSSFAITGSAPNFTLVCSKLACSLAANPASPLSPLGAATTLSTSCNPAGSYTYAWSKAQGNDARCPPAPVSASSSVSISGTGQAVSGCVYQVDVNGGANGNGVANVSLDWTTNAPPPVSAPTGCSIAANPSTLPAGGGAVTLTASCSGGGAPTSYVWTGGAIAANTTVASQSTNVTTSTAFTVTPRNAGGAGNAAGVTVSVSPIIAEGGGFCSQYANVQPVIDLNWGQGETWKTANMGGFPQGGIYVFRLTVPVDAQISAAPGSFWVAEYIGAPTYRLVMLSTQACDFVRAPDPSGVNGPLTGSNGTSANINYRVVTNGNVGTMGDTAGLVAGRTYYFSVRNWFYGGGSSCDTICNAIMTSQPARP